MLEALKQPSKEALCTMMQDAIKQFDDKDLKIFIDSLGDPAWSARELAKQLTKLGFPISDGKIWKHRTKACRCA
jgi:hypothetical protein